MIKGASPGVKVSPGVRRPAAGARAGVSLPGHGPVQPDVIHSRSVIHSCDSATVMGPSIDSGAIVRDFASGQSDIPLPFIYCHT